MDKNEKQRLNQLMATALRAIGYEGIMDGFSESERELLDEIEDNPDGFLRVREAALALQVTVATLQNADRRGTFPALRHPLTGRRLYRRGKVDDLSRKALATKRDRAARQ